MKIRVLVVVLAVGFLGGCSSTDWDHAVSYVGMGDTPAAAPAQMPEPAQTAATPVAPEPPAPVVNEWCAQMAKAAQNEAAGQGFDQATQQRRAQSAYQQCSTSPGTVVN